MGSADDIPKDNSEIIITAKMFFNSWGRTPDGHKAGKTQEKREKKHYTLVSRLMGMQKRFAEGNIFLQHNTALREAMQKEKWQIELLKLFDRDFLSERVLGEVLDRRISD